MRRKDFVLSFVLFATVIAFGALQSAVAQTTVFTHQGKLDFDGVPANGQFDFQFRLFDALTVGLQQGATLERLTVNVTDGDYRIDLDFGASVFPGADRFLEVSYRFSGSTTYAILPRQQITSTPYAIRSLVATTSDAISPTCTNCVTSSQIQSVQGSQVTGSISGSQISGPIPIASVPAGSSSYIQNTTSPQPAANFNILGSGTAGTLSGTIVNATTQYNLGGVRILGNAGRLSNLFVGLGAGAENAVADTKNSFFGSDAGEFNTSGDANSFFGYFAGQSNTTGRDNSFFGSGAGTSNTTSGENSFFGHNAGGLNTTGSNNSFFGSLAGIANTIGADNSFFGFGAGNNNMTGGFNSFFGKQAGLKNSAGSLNTFVGYNTDFDINNPTGNNNSLLGANATIKSGVSFSTAIGTGAMATASNTIVLGTDQDVVIVPGKLKVEMLGNGGNQHLCINNANRLAPCSSSLRYKTDLRPFAAGMAIIDRLQPVSFTWKDGGMRDLGFGAEEVEKVEPLLVTYNTERQVEGVKYDRITVALVNALKEHQQQLAAQQRQIEQQKDQIEDLKRLFCKHHAFSRSCR
jgi:hypothetical protein